MYRLEPKDQRALLKVALGLEPADWILANVQLVNVLTGEIYPADIYVSQGFIAHIESTHIGQYGEARKVIDGQGRYLIPGLIDAHVHIESSMLTPRHFAETVLVHGTTTVITDPHEIANVFGVRGVRYMHEASEHLPMRQLINIPSCVPAVPGLEESGADFTHREIASLLDLSRIIGLAEVMDYLAVIHGEDRMMQILNTAKTAGLYLQGHAPFLTGRMLSAYLIGGPNTCHESRLPSEFLEKMRLGMYVDARESSIAKNVSAAIDGTRTVRFFDQFCLCTDDREPDDLIEIGHMNEVVRAAIRAGMDPILAIKAATINTAREARLDRLGAIAPGYVADFLIVDNLEELCPLAVYFEGNLVAENGRLISPITEITFPIEQENSVHLPPLNMESMTFYAPISSGTIPVTVMTYQDYGLSSTDAVIEDLPVKNGILDLSHDPDLKYVAVINRHGSSRVGLGVVRRFGTVQGAVASTVSHDSHNLTVVYDRPEQGYLAAVELAKQGGGMIAVNNNQVKASLPLSLAGLMSVKKAAMVANEASEMKRALKDLGLTQMDNPLLRIVTLALPVIPNCKMSDYGIIDVNMKTILPLYPKN